DSMPSDGTNPTRRSSKSRETVERPGKKQRPVTKGNNPCKFSDSFPGRLPRTWPKSAPTTAVCLATLHYVIPRTSVRINLLGSGHLYLLEASMRRVVRSRMGRKFFN